MNDLKEESIINSLRDENGNIRNLINYPLFFKHMKDGVRSSNPDTYLAFILKTVIDDFTTVVSSSFPDLKDRKKELQTSILKDIEFLLPHNTTKSE